MKSRKRKCMKNKNTLLIGLLVISTLLLLPTITAKHTKTIKIGVIAADQDWYETSRQLFEEVIEPEINEYVAKLPRFRFQPEIEFDFIVEHADGQVAVHLEKVQMFHEMGVDLIIGGYWSSQAQGSLDYVNENDMLLLSPSSTGPLLAIPDDNLFRLAPVDPVQGKVIAKMMRSKGVDDAIVLHRGDQWGDSVYEVFETEFAAMGGSIIGVYSYVPETTDFSGYLADAEMDAVGASNLGILLISFEEVVDIIREAENYPTIFNPPWFGAEGAGRSWQTLEDAPDQAVYLKLYSPWNAPPSSPKYEDFVVRYEALTGEEPNYYVANEFDAAWLIAQAVLETRPTVVGRRSRHYDATDIIKVLPDIASRYYGYSGDCLLNEAGDRLPGSYDIWGYYMDNGDPSFKKYGKYDYYTDEITWYP